MRSRTKTALKAATGLATVALAFQSLKASAQNDPFALPPQTAQGCEAHFCRNTSSSQDPTADRDRGTYYADVVINGERQDRIVAMRGVGNELAIASGFALSAGIVRTLPDTEFVRLSSVEGLTHSFDTRSYILSIEMPLYSNGANLVSFAGARPRAVTAISDLTALIVDYDLSAQLDGDGAHLSGLVAPRLVRGNVALEASARFDTSGGRESRGVTRLETALTIREPAETLSATLGDFISQAPNGARAVRMGGIRIGTDFDLRPDIVTQPLPDFVDSVAVPTSLDVLVNDRRVGSAQIQSGEFTVRDIPVPVGRSEVGVVVRDALGRETIRTVNFYSSRALLAPELREAALNVGAVRRNYGRASNDYGPLAVSSMYRQGLTSRLTAGVMVELGGRVSTAGVTGDLVIGDQGILSVVMRASRANYFSTGEQGGTLVEIGYESVGRELSYSVQYRTVSPYFADIASANGDAPPPSLIAANIGFDLRDYGKVRLSAIQQERRNASQPTDPAQVTRLISANYRHRVRRGINLSLDASYRSDRRGHDGLSFLVGLSMSLGGSRFGQVSYSHSSGHGYLQGGYYDPDIEPLDTGYSLVAGLGSTHRVAASVSRREHWARMEVQAEVVGSDLAMRAGMRGSLIVADGEVFASEGGSDTYILADANGINDLEIQRENRPAGTTGRGGSLLIGQVPGYNEIKIGFDPARLPTDVSAGSIEEYVTAAPRSVARVQLDVTRYIPRIIALVDPRGERFPPGTVAIAMPSRSEYIVGLDGRLELNAALDDASLEIIEPSGEICRAELIESVTTERGHEMLRCFIRSRTYAFDPSEASSAIASPKNRKCRKRASTTQACRRSLSFGRW
ncbi:fimbria/pilus outer membrane usher protein [Erythrobacter alti]|uniref:fimbria/pilus outer membrane usher protein n=1 Tax=Erythrobacter alti TaxID=1896145 RepID=UPI0030F39D72